MGDIYVELGPMEGGKAPKEYAASAQDTMKATAKKAVDKAKGFTSSKKGAGFNLRLKVAELTVDGKSVSCKLSGELLRYPKPEMVTTSLSAGAKADGGKPADLVQDCVEAATEAIMGKVIPVMKAKAP